MNVEYLPPELEDFAGLGSLPSGPFTVDDLARLWEQVPDSGYRFELDAGALVVRGVPSLHHQIASSALTTLLGNAKTAEYLAVAATGVVISPGQFRIPDLSVLRADRITPGMRHYPYPPALAVEIASPSTERYDRTRKMQVYAEFGIPDYWIVTPDPGKPDVTAYRLAGTRYERIAYASGEELFTASRPFPVSFTPAELVA